MQHRQAPYTLSAFDGGKTFFDFLFSFSLKRGLRSFVSHAFLLVTEFAYSSLLIPKYTTAGTVPLFHAEMSAVYLRLRDVQNSTRYPM
jgi:hypothetical protein